jgi:hypothetical protein
MLTCLEEMSSCQSKRANSRVRLAVLHREAETGERLMSGVQATGILADVSIPNLR